MIDLTEEQRQELANAEPTIRDPKTNATYVLVKAEVYARLKELLYDDSPWTNEEMDVLHEEAGRMADNFREKRAH